MDFVRRTLALDDEVCVFLNLAKSALKRQSFTLGFYDDDGLRTCRGNSYLFRHFINSCRGVSIVVAWAYIQLFVGLVSSEVPW